MAASKPKAEVFDPLRAMASAEKKVQESKEPAKQISTIESVSFGEVKAQNDNSVSGSITAPSGSSSSSSSGSTAGKSVPGPTSDCYEPWRDKRASILTKYTTNKRIPVQASFLEEEKVLAPKAVDSAKSRLEELETQAAEAAGTDGAAAGAAAGASASGKSYMSQKEYITHIEEQHERLKVAWEAGERVTSLKIAIQCAKLLGDSSVPQFYPSMYVLLTDILDTFGDLVFERIKRKVTPHNKQRDAGMRTN